MTAPFSYALKCLRKRHSDGYKQHGPPIQGQLTSQLPKHRRLNISNVLFYESFYHFDHFFEHALWPLAIAAASASKLEKNETSGPQTFKPRMDLHEDSEKSLVSAVSATFEVPGIKKEDVQLEVRDGLLTVSAETKSSTEHEEKGFAVRERRFGKFSRSLRLPEGAKDEEIKAAMEDGVLRITFPKTSPEQEPKKITII
ncbi:17.6 kDa class I heat shock protein 3 [Leucoagaricus sp. SymC.cos]|nr:17.6 kDa class I heat shock protein 3 [Leucoagaricus sp. SymC.cos]